MIRKSTCCCLQLLYIFLDRYCFIVIGVKDFIPQPCEDGYEGFELLIDKANTWFKDQPDITVTNFQSVMVQRDDGEIFYINNY